MTGDEHDLIKAAREMVSHIQGEIQLPTRKFSPPGAIDIPAIRRELGYTQKEFASRFGFTLGAVRDWEQGRRYPEGPARTLLAIIKFDPQIIPKALELYQKGA